MVIIMDMSLVVTGTIGIDTVETASGQAEGVMGGSCTYFAAAASLLAPVRIVAAVGDDWPDEHAAVLSGASVRLGAPLTCASDLVLRAHPGKQFIQ